MTPFTRQALRACTLFRSAYLAAPAIRHAGKATALAGLALCMHAGAHAATAQSPQLQLQGNWMCAASAIALPAGHALPAGTLTQRTAYSADAQGRWNSNSIVTFTASAGQGQYRVRTTAQGINRIRGQMLREVLLRFEIQKPLDASSPFAQSVSRPFNAFLMALMRHSLLRQYRLHDVTADSYVLEPVLPKGRKSLTRSACFRVMQDSHSAQAR